MNCYGVMRRSKWISDKKRFDLTYCKFGRGSTGWSIDCWQEMRVGTNVFSR